MRWKTVPGKDSTLELWSWSWWETELRNGPAEDGDTYLDSVRRSVGKAARGSWLGACGVLLEISTRVERL